MGDLESYSFDDGVQVGDEFLQLCSAIDSDFELGEFLSTDELDPLFVEITKRATYGRPFRCVEGLLSRILRATEFETPLMTIWGLDEFWGNQSDYAPICEIPAKEGFIQFGSWTGESDGDAWLIDTSWGRISAMDVGSGDPDPDQVRLACYGGFGSPWQWISFLRCVAWEREWIPKTPIR